MRSKIEIELKANGTLSDITQGEDKIFQGAVGVTEYHLSVASGITGDYNWRATDIVYMSLKRNDGQTAQVKMTAENGGWVWTSNGWETDVDISGTGNLELSFICKRYSIISVGTVAFEKTTEKIDLIVYESAGYVPQNIDIEIAEELQEAINVLQLDKVGRYSVSEENLPYLPAEIIFDLDGAKTPNNVYFDFTNNVVDYDGETREKIGAILVISNDGVQTELFLTSDGKMYSRTIDGGVTDFVSTAKVDFEFYTYNKVEIDQKNADTLQSAKDYADENFYNETDADNRFVHLSGNETIADTKTFSASPIVPTPSANTHAVNRKYVTDNFYDKAQIGNLTSPISFATQQQFFDWLAGEYVRPDGILTQDLLLGKKVIIQETGKNNYQVAQVPALSIECYKILIEDNKYASEIGFVPYKDITATDTQDAVEQVKDQIDEKVQIAELGDLTILTSDWVEDGGNVFYDYESEYFTNPLKQFFDFNSNDKTQNETIMADQFQIIELQNILIGSTYKVRIFANKVSSFDLTYKVLLYTYTDEIIEQGEISANKVTYDNTTSGLSATNVKTAIDELASEKINKLLNQSTLFPLEDLFAVATTSTEQSKVLMASVGSYTPPNTPIKVATFDNYGKLGSLETPSNNTDFTPKSYVDTKVPAKPANEDTKYLGWDGLGNAIWKDIILGVSGYRSNLYLSNINSDVSGYKKINYFADESETEKATTVTNQEVLAESFLYDAQVGVETLDAGVWSTALYCKVSAIKDTTWYRVVGFLRHVDTTETQIFSMTSNDINNTDYNYLTTEHAKGSIPCAITDRIGFKVYIGTTHNAPITVTYKKGDGDASYFNTPVALRHNQLRGLNEDSNFLHITSTEKDNMESKENKVISLSSSSTDTEYPSAKAVYNFGKFYQHRLRLTYSNTDTNTKTAKFTIMITNKSASEITTISAIYSNLGTKRVLASGHFYQVVDASNKQLYEVIDFGMTSSTSASVYLGSKNTLTAGTFDFGTENSTQALAGADFTEILDSIREI